MEHSRAFRRSVATALALAATPALAHGEEALLGLTGAALGLSVSVGTAFVLLVQRRRSFLRCASATLLAFFGCGLLFALASSLMRPGTSPGALAWFLGGLLCTLLPPGILLLWRPRS